MLLIFGHCLQLMSFVPWYTTGPVSRGWGGAVRCRGKRCSYLQASPCGKGEKPSPEFGREWAATQRSTHYLHDTEGSWRCLHTHWYRILEKGIYCGWYWFELFWNFGFLNGHSRIYKGWKHKNNWASFKLIFGGDPVVPELAWIPPFPQCSLEFLVLGFLCTGCISYLPSGKFEVLKQHFWSTSYSVGKMPLLN